MLGMLFMTNIIILLGDAEISPMGNLLTITIAVLKLKLILLGQANSNIVIANAINP
jgi:hypothetical protein